MSTTRSTRSSSRSETATSGARFLIHWLKVADKRRKASIIFVDNIKRLSTAEAIDHRHSRPSTSSNERLQISYQLPSATPYSRTCGLGDRSCRVVNMKHTFSRISLLSPRVSPELFSTTASYPEIPCTRPMPKGFPGADLSGCIADRIFLAYHSLMCRKLFLLPLIASVDFMHPRKVSSRNLITRAALQNS